MVDRVVNGDGIAFVGRVVVGMDVVSWVIHVRPTASKAVT